VKDILGRFYMASDNQKPLQLQPSDEQQNPEYTTLDTQEPGGLQVYQSQIAPLPGHRPIADNTNPDEMNALIGYLD
jgi:hypothetical protein